MRSGMPADDLESNVWAAVAIGTVLLIYSAIFYAMLLLYSVPACGGYAAY